jgi:short-subunit dehydrogenase
MSAAGVALAERAAVVLEQLRERRPGIGDGDASKDGCGRTALVTGASSGIGWSMSELLAAKGFDVVPVARREQRLKQLGEKLEERWGVQVHPIPCDLGDPEAATYIRDELVRRGLAVDFLVNNAGYVLHGPYLENSWADEMRFVRVLALSGAELSRYLLPHMVEQRWGRIINVTSVASMMPGTPGMVLYSAAKGFTHKFSEGLAADYEKFGVHCTVSVVGATDTELQRTPAIWEYVGKNPFIQLTTMRPETVARQAYDACMAGRRVVVNGWSNKIWTFVLVHAPRGIRYRLVNFNAKVGNPPSDSAAAKELGAAATKELP